MKSFCRLCSALSILVIIASATSQAGAQGVSSNPFASAEALLSDRGEPPHATLRLRYEKSGDIAGFGAGEVVIDVASDWARVQLLDRRTIYDFRLGRIFDLGDGTFVSGSIGSDLAFRVFERQNRQMMNGALRSAGVDSPMDGCDAETELGVVIPQLNEPAAVQMKDEGAATTLECNGRVMGVVEESKGDVAPAALWPVMARIMTMHPALFARASEKGVPPQRVEATLMSKDARTSLWWRLRSAETIDEPYPLTPNLTNATAALLNEGVSPGLAEIAADAVAGRALGGVPTLAKWDADARRRAEEQGPASASFVIWPTLGMFPQVMQMCQSGSTLAICEMLRNLKNSAASDMAVRTFLEVARAEQERRPRDAIVAMSRGRSSRNADDPVLGASFALALVAGGSDMQEKARAAGLPYDTIALQVKALRAYPYNPSYWTDLGDNFLVRFEISTAYLLYDVALSLPMPDAQRDNAVLASKRNLAARLQADFPTFFLPQ